MKINVDYKGKKLVFVYSSKGILKHVINAETNKKMVLEETQQEVKYNIPVIEPAKYIRIVELDVLISNRI